MGSLCQVAEGEREERDRHADVASRRVAAYFCKSFPNYIEILRKSQCSFSIQFPPPTTKTTITASTDIVGVTGKGAGVNRSTISIGSEGRAHFKAIGLHLQGD